MLRMTHRGELYIGRSQVGSPTGIGKDLAPRGARCGIINERRK